MTESAIPWEFPVAAFFSETEPKAVHLDYGDLVNRNLTPAPDWNEVAVECVNRINPPERYRVSLIAAIVAGIKSEVSSAGGWKNYAMKVKPSSTELDIVDPESAETRDLKAQIHELKKFIAEETQKQEHGQGQESKDANPATKTSPVKDSTK